MKRGTFAASETDDTKTGRDWGEKTDIREFFRSRFKSSRSSVPLFMAELLPALPFNMVKDPKGEGEQNRFRVTAAAGWIDSSAATSFLRLDCRRATHNPYLDTAIARLAFLLSFNRFSSFLLSLLSPDVLLFPFASRLCCFLLRGVLHACPSINHARCE